MVDIGDGNDGEDDDALSFCGPAFDKNHGTALRRTRRPPLLSVSRKD